MSINLEDTRNCPRREECQVCGHLGEVVTVTARSAVGVACMGLCWDCQESEPSHVWAFLSDAEQVVDHCTHLGIDLTTMTAALRQERTR
ncbi:hypothetical protein Kisp01_10100 [Kineosporia sp. NBRC 101677]|uniref:hypothetical protein n=1 Tax=Kineosporia sp. NBRC 101677 TaxID=3032197 RepID=UPI0024A3B434|nr:hypothetical protein [Kineosporia sp. NBRC 101677]GLY13994.1 hypothetical protein Kisp01_10100 [Kineosporia sp. NBRC 101677]